VTPLLALLLVALGPVPGGGSLAGSPPAARERARLGEEVAPLGTRERVRALLEAAGLSRIEFDAPERLGAAHARLAWTSRGILGFVTLEARSQRSTDELDRDLLQLYATGCRAAPELRSAAPETFSGYTLHQASVRCRVHDGVRLAVITSVLDAADILSLVHMGLESQAEGLDRVNRSLGERLRMLLRR
jgi:hypothetical protein